MENTFVKTVDPKLAGKNLWHLFCTEESFKIETFLDGGLWCSDLGSITGFQGDPEGSKFHGIFVSCWHVNEGDPSDVAWKIFGGDGDGFAIRTSPEKLLALVNAVGAERITARLVEVPYTPASVVINGPAYQVSESHSKEEEVRLVLRLGDGGPSEDALKDKIRELVPSHCKGRAYERPIRRLTLSEIDDMDFGLIVPTDPVGLFDEFLVGPNVTPADRDAVMTKLYKAGVHCAVRNLQKRS